MNLSTILLLCALVCAAAFALRWVRRHRGGGCSGCSGCSDCRERGGCTRPEKK